MMPRDMTELSETMSGAEGGPVPLLGRRSFLRATLGSAAAGAAQGRSPRHSVAVF